MNKKGRRRKGSMRCMRVSTSNLDLVGLREVGVGVGEEDQTSVDAGSDSINTLYNLLLIAGPILRSVSAPLRFADF